MRTNNVIVLLMEAARTRTVLLLGVSHQIKSPLPGHQSSCRYSVRGSNCRGVLGNAFMLENRSAVAHSSRRASE